MTAFQKQKKTLYSKQVRINSSCDSIFKTPPLTDNRPPLFTQKSLIIATKIIAIYALFFMVTAFIPIFKNPVSENPLWASNHYAPVYFAASVHLIVFIVSATSVFLKKYFWPLAISCMIVVFMSRFYYTQIALWVWEWSS
jgi:hypothetical protein